MSEKATTADKNAAAIERWPIAKVTPYARNARTVPETAIVKVAASIREFGFKTPMLVEPDGTIIAGHTRLLAAMPACAHDKVAGAERILTASSTCPHLAR